MPPHQAYFACVVIAAGQHVIHHAAHLQIQWKHGIVAAIKTSSARGPLVQQRVHVRNRQQIPLTHVLGHRVSDSYELRT